MYVCMYVRTYMHTYVFNCLFLSMLPMYLIWFLGKAYCEAVMEAHVN